MGDITRRDFLKTTAAAGMGAALSSSCTTSGKSHHLQKQDAFPRLFTHGRLVDLSSETIRDPIALLVKDQIIQDIGPPSQFTGITAESVNLKGHYLLPGLIDAHCHLTLPSLSSFSPGLTLAAWRQLRKNMRNQILSGVIHVRDMGAMPPILRLLEREVEKGEIPGPIVIKANAIFNVDGGHPDVSPADISWAAAMGTLFTGAPSVNFKNAELQKAFEANCRSADFVKLTMDDTSLVAGKPDINRYSDDQLKTIFDLANTHNMPVAAHAMRRFGVRRVLDYPVHSLEHTVCDGPFSKKDIAQMVKRRVKVIPTTILGNLYTFTNLAEPTPNGLVSERALAEASLRQAHFDGLSFDTVEPAIHQNNLMMLEKLKTLSFKDLYKKGYYTINPHQYLPIFTHGKKNLMRMRNAGIPIGCGTDAGVPFNYHGHIAREMQCMHRLGFTNTEILIAATKTNAEILGIEKHAGTIQKGKEAHFIAMKENPLNDLSALTSLSLVVKQGHIQNA